MSNVHANFNPGQFSAEDLPDQEDEDEDEETRARYRHGDLHLPPPNGGPRADLHRIGQVIQAHKAFPAAK